MQYRPDLPDRFGSLENARAHCQQFFRRYNHKHRHGGIGLMTPAAVHDGIAAALTAQRALTLDAVFAANPIRFKSRAEVTGMYTRDGGRSSLESVMTLPWLTTATSFLGLSTSCQTKRPTSRHR